MTFLWILLGIIYVACWIYFGLSTFRKGHYWMFWDRILLPVPLDHWRIDRPDSTRRRHGIGATVVAKYSRLVERSLLGQPASCW